MSRPEAGDTALDENGRAPTATDTDDSEDAFNSSYDPPPDAEPVPMEEVDHLIADLDESTMNPTGLEYEDHDYGYPTHVTAEELSRFPVCPPIIWKSSEQIEAEKRSLLSTASQQPTGGISLNRANAHKPTTPQSFGRSAGFAARRVVGGYGQPQCFDAAQQKFSPPPATAGIRAAEVKLVRVPGVPTGTPTTAPLFSPKSTRSPGAPALGQRLRLAQGVEFQQQRRPESTLDNLDHIEPDVERSSGSGVARTSAGLPLRTGQLLLGSASAPLPPRSRGRPRTSVPERGLTQQQQQQQQQQLLHRSPPANIYHQQQQQLHYHHQHHQSPTVAQQPQHQQPQQAPAHQQQSAKSAIIGNPLYAAARQRAQQAQQLQQQAQAQAQQQQRRPSPDKRNLQQQSQPTTTGGGYTTTAEAIEKMAVAAAAAQQQRRATSPAVRRMAADSSTTTAAAAAVVAATTVAAASTSPKASATAVSTEVRTSRRTSRPSVKVVPTAAVPGTPKKETKNNEDGLYRLEGYTQRCICGLPHDDDSMVACDQCDVWQHVSCMQLSRVPNKDEQYKCERCDPRPHLSREEARAIQKDAYEVYLRKQQGKSKRKSSTAAASTSTTDSGSAVKQARRSAAAAAPRLSSPTSSAVRLFKEITENQYSGAARRIVQEFGDTARSVDILTKAGNARCRPMIVAKGIEGLVATEDVARGSILSPYTGFVCVPTECTDRRGGAALPNHTVLYTGIARGGAELLIDARRMGNDARVVRRSCLPNASLKHVIHAKRIHFVLVAGCPIEKGTEVTIPFDADFEGFELPAACACQRQRDQCNIVQRRRLADERREQEAASAKRKSRLAAAAEEAPTSSPLSRPPAAARTSRRSAAAAQIVEPTTSTPSTVEEPPKPPPKKQEKRVEEKVEPVPEPSSSSPPTTEAAAADAVAPTKTTTTTTTTEPKHAKEEEGETAGDKQAEEQPKKETTEDDEQPSTTTATTSAPARRSGAGRVRRPSRLITEQQQEEEGAQNGGNKATSLGEKKEVEEEEGKEESAATKEKATRRPRPSTSIELVADKQMDYSLPSERNRPSREERKLALLAATGKQVEKKPAPSKRRSSIEEKDEKKSEPVEPTPKRETSKRRRSLTTATTTTGGARSSTSDGDGQKDPIRISSGAATLRAQALPGADFQLPPEVVAQIGAKATTSAAADERKSPRGGRR